MPSKGLRKLARGFKSDLNAEEMDWRTQNRINSGNEQQSELLPSRAPTPTPPRRSATPSAKPARSGPGRAPLPPRRPSTPTPGPTQPMTPTHPGGPPIVPGEPKYTGSPGGGMPLPGVNPLGDVTGAPLNPPPIAPQPTDMMPPLTGPNSDRAAGIAPGMSPGDAWAARVNTALPPMPQGQSGLTAALGALMPGAAAAPAGPPPPAPNVAQAAAMSPPDRPVSAPPGILDQVNSGIAGAGDWLKRNVPPLRF